MTPNILKSLVALSMLLGSTIASPLSTSQKLESRAGTYAITGVTDSGVQPRLEIRQIAADPVQFNLFLLAMIEYQAIDQSQLLSFYQISAIHGLPVIPWDGVEGSGSSGYCTHASNLFGPWHRPYLALFEQQIHEIGVAIAAQFPAGSIGDSYHNASSTLRLPYWDWAANPDNNGPVLPPVLSSPTAGVTYPNGSQATVPNPLYSYTFHPLVPGDFQNASPFNQWNSTLRWPTSSASSATSQDSQAETQLEANLPNFRTQLMTLFSNWQPYNTFSNEGSGSAGFGNLESIHDTVHVTVGGYSAADGHMSIVPVAAYDPIFWFHHANIDRFLALWQAVYPDTYVEPTKQEGGTFTIQAGSIQDVNSPLTPFHQDTAGTFYTSSAVRSTEVLGYSYPEIINKPSNDSLQATIASLYGGAPAKSFKRQASNTTISRDYLVKIDLPWSAINGTYSVAVFLGKSNAAPGDWAKDPAYVGMHATLGSTAQTPNVVATSNVHLTDALINKYSEGDLENLEEDTIVSYLTENLEWKTQKDGSEIAVDSLAGVQATAQSIENAAPSAPGTFENFRWVGAFKEYPGVFAN